MEEWEDQHELHQIILHMAETEFIITTEWVQVEAVDRVTGQIVVTLPVETMVADGVQAEVEIAQTLARKVVHSPFGISLQALRDNRLRASSIGLSVGLAQAALVISVAGRPTTTFCGGIGFRNHLS